MTPAFHDGAVEGHPRRSDDLERSWVVNNYASTSAAGGNHLLHPSDQTPVPPSLRAGRASP